MKLIVEKIQDLQALYVRQLRLLLSAEEMIAIKTPFFTERATDTQLQELLRQQSAEGESNAARLRGMLSRTGSESVDPIKCKAIYALFDEAEDLVEDSTHGVVRDAVLVAEAQRIKPYEVAAYTVVRELARVLGHVEDERLMAESVHQKDGANKRLSIIAERVNPAAKVAQRAPAALKEVR
jgi:ferritin-like metal-binding protein YciE